MSSLLCRARTWAVARAARYISRDLLAYLGPGFLVTVGFIDPGNWATNIAAGADHGYTLLWVIAVSTLMLVLLQGMSARIGIVTGRSLAANVKGLFPRWASVFLGSTIVCACMATDLAEYLGAALGFQMLFGIPPIIGAPITVAIVFIAILGQRYQHMERMIVGFLAIIAACYMIEVLIVDPDWSQIPRGVVVPRVSPDSILVALGMLGAVVMPHNIYLHSNVIQSRHWGSNSAETRRLLRFQMVDTVLAMGTGWVVNSSMIVVAAAVFHRHGVHVTSIEQAAATLKPIAGQAAHILFGVALLFSGIGSSITSSLSEANLITNYLGRPEDPHSLTYRVGLIATSLPAMAVIVSGVDSYKALIISQVVLSLQLPFTILPLILVARNRRVMGEYASSTAETLSAVVAGTVVIGLNGFLLYQTFAS
ncbi:MAG: Nramp family divalent metal transporter [Armatimonadota bacterium]